MTGQDVDVTGIGPKAYLTQFQIQTAAYVSGGLRIAVQSGIQADTLQVAALHIRGDRIHLIRAGIEYLHAVNGC